MVKGQSNLVADALSRLPTNSEPLPESHFTEELRSFHYCYAQKEMEEQPFPLRFSLIEKHQLCDKSLVKAFVMELVFFN